MRYWIEQSWIVDGMYVVILVNGKSEQIMFEGSEEDCEKWIENHRKDKL